MATTLTAEPNARHLLVAESRPRMAKADLRKAEMDDWRLHVGGAIERMRMLSGLSLKEFAAVLGRDERQVARWITGAERPQLDVLFAADDLRQSLVIALAELAGAGIEVETTVRIRRSA